MLNETYNEPLQHNKELLNIISMGNSNEMTILITNAPN